MIDPLLIPILLVILIVFGIPFFIGFKVADSINKKYRLKTAIVVWYLIPNSIIFVIPILVFNKFWTMTALLTRSLMLVGFLSIFTIPIWLIGTALLVHRNREYKKTATRDFELGASQAT
ncbi:MAG: hypothetical protein ABSB89_07760 [Candidatus Bathyarchaeia archaeon]|jgi:predicted MFS family arabinose efflux permease